MLSFLKNHPFAVEAFFESSVVLAFALPKAQLQSLIPPCLTLDTYNDQWAFVAVALVQTTALRPKGFPRFMGNNFFLAGYRIFVRYTNKAGKRLRGLYILGSVTDKKKMEWLGNTFTQYRYTTADFSHTTGEGITTIQSMASQLHIRFADREQDVPLPAGSPFPDWAAARRFAGPLPFTFSYNPAGQRVTIIEGVREQWTPQPISILSYQIGFLDQLGLQDAILANAFIVRNIPYHWKKGKTEPWP
jgi:Uncharacterized conserved protein (COG2071)